MYRSLDAILEERLARYRERCARERDAAATARAILSRRAAWVAAGRAGTIFGIGTFVMGLLDWMVRSVHRSPWPARLFAGGWLAAAGAGGIVFAWTRYRTRRGQLREPSLTGDALRDLPALSRTPLDDLAAAAHRLERASAGWPLTALALLGPFAVLLVVAFFEDDALWRFDARDISDWIEMSAFMVLPHLAFLAGSSLWGFSLSALDAARLDARAPLAAVWTWGLTAFASLVPPLWRVEDGDAIADHLSSVVCWTTPFLTAMFVATASRIAWERALLSRAAPARAQPWNTARPGGVRP